MNLEEARNNIGSEVELDESTKPYNFMNYGSIWTDDVPESAVFEIRDTSHRGVIISNKSETLKFMTYPRHLKLKPQNYKIHVPTEEESKEAQELFFELGYGFFSGESKVFENFEYTGDFYFFAYGKDMDLTVSADSRLFVSKNTHKQITLQDLRDVVAKKKGIKSIGVDLASGENKTMQVTGTFQNFEPRKEMKWENALRAVADGKEVEILDSYGNWERIGDFYIDAISSGEFDFRLAPQRIKLNGEYTKEELLQKIGEMK